MDITGKVAVVFGGARGIGRAYCEALLNKGAKVCVCDVLKADGQAAEKELKAADKDYDVFFMECNVTEKEQIKNVFEETISRYGQVDIVVNNCGVIHELQWEKCVDVNLNGNIRCVNAALQYMGKDRGGNGGVYITTSSISGLRPEPWGPVYSATKHAIVGLIRSWALDENIKDHGVRMNCICPTRVMTPFLQQIHPDRMYHAAEHQACDQTGNELRPSEIAEGLIKLIEEGHNGKALRITKEHGLDFATFQDQPLQ